MVKHEDFLSDLKEAGRIIEPILKQHPELDANDLYQIYFCLKMTPDERLQRGLRRRVIYGGAHTID